VSCSKRCEIRLPCRLHSTCEGMKDDKGLSPNHGVQPTPAGGRG
jgi:hypothetical protein